MFKSTDGGQNWVNLSTPTLDGQHMTNIEHQRGSNGGVYLGTRTTVFYRNDSMPDWVIYDNNLPRRTLSTQLVPYYKEGLLINGTNRSVYEIDFYEDSSPSAQIARILRPPRICSAIANISLTLSLGTLTLIFSSPDSIWASNSWSTVSSLRRPTISADSHTPHKRLEGKKDDNRLRYSNRCCRIQYLTLK